MKLKMIFHSLTFFCLLLAGLYFFSNCASSGKNERQSYTEKDREAIRNTSGTEEERTARRGTSRRRGRRRSRSPRSDPTIDCETCTTPLPYCNSAETECVQCKEGAHCRATPNTPNCNPDNNTCVACVDDTDCENNYVCTNNACVPCDTKCNPGESCDSRRICMRSPPCTTPENDPNDCTSSLPVCVDERVCVECKGDEDDLCTDADKVCKDSDNVCVECLSDGNCRGKSGGRNTCDTNTNTCVVCVPGSRHFLSERGQGCESDESCKVGGICVECTHDSHCDTTEGEVCNPNGTCTDDACGGCESDEFCIKRLGLCVPDDCSDGPNRHNCLNPCDTQEYYGRHNEPIGPLDGWSRGEPQEDACWGNLYKLMKGKDGVGPCSNTPSWLKDPNNFCSSGYENIQIDGGRVIWHNGYFRGRQRHDGNEGKSGRWRGGDFKSGSMRDTLWENGVFEGNWFEDSIWKNGTWRGNTFCASVWEGGTWEEGYFYNGIFKAGTWEDGTWYFGDWQAADSNWRGGQCRRSRDNSLVGPLPTCSAGSPPNTVCYEGQCTGDNLADDICYDLY